MSETKPNFYPESELILNPDGSIYHLNLLPHQIADTILTVGDPDRVGMVSKYFNEVEYKISKREFVTHTGYYRGKRLSVISSGIGTDNVEILMHELDALVNIDLSTRQDRAKHTALNIIRIGTSGSMQASIPYDSHVASKAGVGLDTLMCFYELELTKEEQEIGNELQELIGLPFTPYCVHSSEKLLEIVGEGLVKGNTVTSPGFYAPQGRKLRYELKLPWLMDNLSSYKEGDFELSNFEMETSAYYALGRILGHEMLSCNAIIANRATQEFSPDPKKAVDELIKKVLERTLLL
ncbi:nucleoside phosphorylase [Flammeovirgaceae bacterium SG7u.111]|nr:nucleoside phosphorylase [Flammeovirgaceae bacterium SG7u.132]WPO36061.1 nucleoside phosphorylase [Flammeovirgaceae bacterium SG7u.111]